MSFSNVGKVWTPSSLAETLAQHKTPKWCDTVTLHHTAVPSLAQRPRGWTVQHMRNLKHYYGETQGWSAGPHFFVDEDQVFGLSPFTARGVHAASFNKSSIGVEVLGNFNSEPAKTGRGLQCWKIAAETTVVLLDWMGTTATAETVLFHRDDPKTAKHCPGKKVKKDWVLKLIANAGDPKSVRTPRSDIAEEKPNVPGWTAYRNIDDRWYVPVLGFLVHLGVNEDEVIAKLKARGGKFYYDGDLLEGAFYQRDRKATMAPARELLHFA